MNCTISRLLHSSRVFLAILACFVLVSCAGSAPPLPEDTTATNRARSLSLSDFSSTDAATDCTAIRLERGQNNAKIEQDKKAIESNRRQNQVAGYLGTLLVVPLIATESNDAEKNDITTLQQRQDVLNKLAAVKQCPM